MLTLRATANHLIALQYLCMCLMSQMFLFYFIFLWGCYGGALVFLGGAGAPASPSLAPPMMADEYWTASPLRPKSGSNILLHNAFFSADYSLLRPK